MVKNKTHPAHKSYQLEKEVAAIYQTLGAQVEPEISLAGNRIDMLVTERTSSGVEVRTAVECKAYAMPVGTDIVHMTSSPKRGAEIMRVLP